MENIEADISREQEPVKIADGDLGLQIKNQYLIPLSRFLERHSLRVKNLDLKREEI